MHITPADELRVAIDVSAEDGSSGGVQQWIIGLANALSDLEPPEEYMFLVTQGNEGWLEPHVRGPCRIVLRSRGDRSTQSRWTSARADIAQVPGMRRAWHGLRRRKPSVPASDGLAEALGAQVLHFPQQVGYRTEIPTVYQPWDLQHLHHPEFFTRDQSAWRETLYPSLCAQASVVITASDWVKHDLVAQYRVPIDHVAVLPVPPPTSAYEPPTSNESLEIIARLRLPKQFAFYPAQTWAHKNHERLLDALALLKADGLVVPLVCSGHLNERHHDLLRRAEGLGVSDQVRFLGFVDPKELLAVYSQARLLVFPSLYEGWGLPIVEAFAQGLPVASSNVTSLPGLVGDAGLLFDPYDVPEIATSIRALWVDDELRGHLKERGRAVLRSLDWHETALRMRAIYRYAAGREVSRRDLSLLADVQLVSVQSP